MLLVRSLLTGLRLCSSCLSQADTSLRLQLTHALLAPALLVARVRRIKFCSKKRGLTPLLFRKIFYASCSFAVNRSSALLVLLVASRHQPSPSAHSRFARSRFLDDFFFNVSGNLFVFLEFH